MINKYIVLCTAAIGGAVCVAAYFYRKKKWNEISDFVFIGKVSQLNVYPVKSMRGVSVPEIECTKIGAKYGELRDRYFLVVDSDTGKFVTARQFPKLVCFTVNVQDRKLYLDYESRHFELNLEEVVRRNDVRRAELWKTQKQDGLDCGDQVADFICLCLQTEDNLRLIYHYENLYTERDLRAKQEWLFSPAPNRTDPMPYADDGPYMALCDNSLEDLKKHLPEEFSPDMRRFRPVIQISDAPAYDEDMWHELKIGDNVQFACYRPCARCIVTTIDPDSGMRRPDNQPLKCLREYRLAPGKLRKTFEQSPIFGICMGVINGGIIHVGDSVYARYKAHAF